MRKKVSEHAILRISLCLLGLLPLVALYPLLCFWAVDLAVERGWQIAVGWRIAAWILLSVGVFAGIICLSIALYNNSDDMVGTWIVGLGAVLLSALFVLWSRPGYLSVARAGDFLDDLAEPVIAAWGERTYGGSWAEDEWLEWRPLYQQAKEDDWTEAQWNAWLEDKWEEARKQAVDWPKDETKEQWIGRRMRRRMVSLSWEEELRRRAEIEKDWTNSKSRFRRTRLAGARWDEEVERKTERILAAWEEWTKDWTEEQRRAWDEWESNNPNLSHTPVVPWLFLFYIVPLAVLFIGQGIVWIWRGAARLRRAT